MNISRGSWHLVMLIRPKKSTRREIFSEPATSLLMTRVMLVRQHRRWASVLRAASPNRHHLIRDRVRAQSVCRSPSRVTELRSMYAPHGGFIRKARQEFGKESRMVTYGETSTAPNRVAGKRWYARTASVVSRSTSGAHS